VKPTIEFATTLCIDFFLIYIATITTTTTPPLVLRGIVYSLTTTLHVTEGNVLHCTSDTRRARTIYDRSAEILNLDSFEDSFVCLTKPTEIFRNRQRGNQTSRNQQQCRVPDMAALGASSTFKRTAFIIKHKTELLYILNINFSN
jgi:hypothetical protein